MHSKPHTHTPKRRRSPAANAAPHAGQAAPDASDAREQRLQQAAYALYLQRGGAPGHALEDWLQAEAMIDAQDRH